MNEQELFDRLQRIDPCPTGVPVTPADAPSARMLLEHIMNIRTNDADANTHATGAALSSSTRRRRARWPMLLGGCATVALVAAGIGMASGDDAGRETADPTVTYSVAPFDPLTTSCLTLSEVTPLPGTQAFRGTVDSVANDAVTLKVAEWLTGGEDAGSVVLDTTGLPSPALDGVGFVDGAEMLISVNSGAVQTCGVSGSASPELEALYANWYPG